MDLLLVHPYFLADDPQEQQVMKPYPPLGLLYLSSHLKAKGVSVGVFDGTFRREAEFEETLRRERPRIVGFYCNLTTKLVALRLMAICRARGLTVLVGGPDPPFHAEAYLTHGADLVVIGEGERTLEALMPRLLSGQRGHDLSDLAGLAYRDDSGAVVRTPPREFIAALDQQPMPDRGAIDIEAYLSAWRSRHGRGSISIITARGCAYTCRWCSRSVYGETHRRRSPENVADEVQAIVSRYHPDMLWYADDVFTVHKGWLHRYAGEMERRGLRLPFECISRAERVDEGVADDLARLGCSRLWIGSESGSQRILDAMSRRVTVEQVRHATTLLQARGIQVGMFIMLGYPGERIADVEATIDHLRRTAPDVFLTTVAYPIAGTPFHEEVGDRLIATKPWAQSTDRDLEIAGRPTRLYFRFLRQWITGDVSASTHWRHKRYARAAKSYAAARVSRAGAVGVAWLAHERVTWRF